MPILIATSTLDFDPSEVAIPWKILHESGQEIIFATDTGQAGTADPIMLTGEGLGLFSPLLIAQKPARDTYDDLLKDSAFQNPISYEQIKVENYDGLLLPGGHAKGCKPYLESTILQNAIVQFFATNKPVGAICHGVIPIARAIDPTTDKSPLFGRQTTALLKRQELLGHKLTKSKMGDYYLTYPTTVEDEVTAALASPSDFTQGPIPIFRDSASNLKPGFTLRDKNYLSARWPGDAHKFANEFLAMIKSAQL